MAKKITLEEYEKKKNIEKNNKSEQKNKLLLPLIIIIVLFSCSFICNVLLLINHNTSSSLDNEEITRLERELNSKEILANSYKRDLDRLVGDKDADYVKEKIDFYDESVVYVIEGFGNYYYSYDCMRKKVGNNHFSYWTYNPEAAQDEGYREGGC